MSGGRQVCPLDSINPPSNEPVWQQSGVSVHFSCGSLNESIVESAAIGFARDGNDISIPIAYAGYTFFMDCEDLCGR